MQIQCQRFPLKREDTQQWNERPQFVLCNSIQTRFNSINQSHSNSNIKQKGKTKMKSKRTPEPDAELVTADAWDKTVIYWLETMPLIKPVRNKLEKLGFNLD